jgi:hypothetical protein
MLMNIDNAAMLRVIEDANNKGWAPRLRGNREPAEPAREDLPLALRR